MKKRLEAELMSIAHRILKLKGKEDLNQLHKESRKVYEMLTVLRFAEDNIDAIEPKINLDVIDQKIKENLDNENETSFEVDKNYIAQLESDIEELKEDLEHIENKIELRNETKTVHFEDLLSGHFSEPIFEKIGEKPTEIVEKDEVDEDFIEKPSNGINISLNDKIGIIKHLFDDNAQDYNRVLSQISTIDTFEDAKDFIINMVKPDYNNWLGEEDFEERFMAILEKNFA